MKPPRVRSGFGTARSSTPDNREAILRTGAIATDEIVIADHPGGEPAARELVPARVENHRIVIPVLAWQVDVRGRHHIEHSCGPRRIGVDQLQKSHRLGQDSRTCAHVEDRARALVSCSTSGAGRTARATTACAARSSRPAAADASQSCAASRACGRRSIPAPAATRGEPKGNPGSSPDPAGKRAGSAALAVLCQIDWRTGLALCGSSLFGFAAPS